MYGKMQGSGLIEIIPLICTSAIEGPVSCTFSSGVSSSALLRGGVAVVADSLIGRHPVSTLRSLGADCGGCNGMA